MTIADSNSGATDTLTINAGGAGGTLSGTGLSGGTGGVYTLSGTAAAVTSELDALSFSPKAGAAGTSSTSTFSLSDVSSAFGTPDIDTKTSVIDTDPAVVNPSVAPTITGTKANQATTSEAPVHPFANVTIADNNSGATDTLTINVGGAGGTLSGTGMSGGTGGVYTLSGTAAAITSELDALSFTPKAGAAGTSSTSTFSLSDVSSAFSTPATDSKTSVIDTDPAVATPPPSTPVAAPNLSVQNHSLAVSSGGHVALGLSVTTPDTSETTVTIKGLASYETITDNLDNKVFSGGSVSLTADEVDSGLTLHSYYNGHGNSVATLTAMATNSLTGKSSASQTITVTDPSSQASTPKWNHSLALLNQYMASGFGSSSSHGQITTTSSSANSQDAWFLAKPSH